MVEPGSDVDGKIVLVSAKDVHESIGVEAVASRGALAALVFQTHGPLYTGRVKYPRSSIPALSLSSGDGFAISRAVRKKKRPRCFIRLRSRLAKGQGKNIFATKRNGFEPKLYVAHRDSRIFSPGAIDNATGTALLLYSARLGSSSYLLSTDAEEYGLIGAKAFARKNGWIKHSTRVVNLDSVGAGKLSLVTKSRAGHLSPELNSKIQRVAEGAGIALSAISLPRGSDSDVFVAEGYETSWLRAYPSPTATTVDDRFEHVRPTIVGKALKLLAVLAKASL